VAVDIAVPPADNHDSSEYSKIHFHIITYGSRIMSGIRVDGSSLAWPLFDIGDI
jgi:hypothetical protein